jgi:hypothetical protein
MTSSGSSYREQTIQSRLDLVDLAGSEGVRHTGNRGLALNEANNINRGLLHLRNVISILSTNTKDFIPYRSSTLTTVLRGKCKCNMQATGGAVVWGAALPTCSRSCLTP